ncbi:aldose 1-epimerase-like [Ipomoea triloba]|uniref:aldose 1-epimerase-like n=1 Tax=Ipomoea triloba TaxID=35885 RepID=UPI00125CDF16|nr:aldose 1-epimerase-like [Ipomoea triloba]
MSNIISAPLFFCFFLTFALAGLVVSVQDAEFYLINKRDFSVKLTNYGARVVSVILPDKNGKLTDVVLGYDTTMEYENDESNFGAIVGRVANRIGGAQFTLNGTLYKLIANDGNNTLHGGPKGFSKVYWKVKKHEESYITFTYHSLDGDQGFPGDVIADVTYSIKENPYKLIVKMNAKAVNKPTPVNLAQHNYWNLGGHDSGDILSEKLHIFASQITPVDSDLIPTGQILPINNTAYDFLEPRQVGPQMAKLPEGSRGGFDINYAIDGYEDVGKRKMVAEVYDERSGIGMEIKASGAAGVQFYTANHLQGVKGKGGAVYESHGALCLETQGFPDAVNHPNFPSTIVTPEHPYHHTMHITLRVHNPRSLRVLESSDSLTV